jgi:hypothetical protein
VNIVSGTSKLIEVTYAIATTVRSSVESDEMMSSSRALILVSSTTTTTFDPHRGAVFPAARVIVLAVPIIVFTLAYLRVKGLKK